MKLLKKLALLILTAVACLAIGVAAGCKDKEETPSGELAEYVYKIRVQSEGGFGLKNVVVGLYDGDTLVKEKTTSAQGNAYFTEEDGVSPGEYDVRLTDVPAGWSANEDITYRTSNASKSDLTVAMTPKLITDQEIPSSKVYQLGDVMYDFTITSSDNQSYTLSTLLEEKKMVLLNFWATWCGPCKSEFPAMQNAYVESTDVVEILAISTTDDQSAVADYKDENGLSFPMAGETNLPSRFAISAVPVSIVIDRYGVISYWHVGSMTAKSDFIGLFDKFTSDDYVQTVIGEGEYGGSDNENTDDAEQVKPNVSAPSTNDANAILNTNGAFKSSWDDGEYSWPFTIETHTSGDKALFASNKGVHNSYSLLYVEFDAAAGDVLFFDAAISTESDADFLHVFIDDTLVHSLSGNSSPEWKAYCAYVFTDNEAGKHTLSFSYVKDSSMSGGEDEVWLKNLRIGSQSEIESTVGGVDIIRNAATIRNEKPADYNGGTKVKQYKNYVTSVYNETDGYYHVGTKEGPLLLANLMNGSLWNQYDLWQLSYNGLLIVDGMDVGAAVEDYAWAANNSVNSYVPVTKDLKHLLQTVTKANDVEGMTADGDYHLADYDEEWLEVCLYFDHYGSGSPVSDPTRGITFEGAIEIFEGKNTIDCFQSIVPIGIKHKFTPTRSGVYHFYSTVSPEYFDTAEIYNPQMWLIDSDQSTFLAESSDFLLHHTGNPENFDVKYYLEANKTYYCLFAFFLNAIGEFEMQIDYLGTYYENLTHCAIGPYSMNMVTNEIYTPDAQYVKYDQANDVYRITNERGVFLGDLYAGLDDKVYWDLTNPTFMFPSDSLKSFIDTYENYATNKRLFYLPGEDGQMKDYSMLMKTVLFKANLNNGALNGKIAVTAELMHIMLELTKKNDGFGGAMDSWQLMCYYYQPIGQP